MQLVAPYITEKGYKLKQNAVQLRFEVAVETSYKYAQLRRVRETDSCHSVS